MGFALRFALLSVAGMLLTVLLVHTWQHTRVDPPPSFDFGSTISVVTIQSVQSGKYLEVSTEDGIVRATGTSPDVVSARFRVHVLSPAAVSAMRMASASMGPWSTSTGGVHTVSGCTCTGFSNEHGFGRYCHPWEDDMEAPWCYVHEDCKGGTLGSFGRRHDTCSVLSRYDDAGVANATAAPPPDDFALPPDGSGGQDGGAVRYVAPYGCPCSGVRSPLGFGGSCRGWEYEGQAPWCYVFDNCSLASAAGPPGSFGHRHIDCVLEARDADGRRLQHVAAASSSSSSSRSPVWGHIPTEEARAFPRRDPQEDALLESVERLSQPHVALVSLATEGFVSVEMPPHRLALRPHARTDALSLRGVFSFLPSGAIVSLATNALLNLCVEPGASADGKPWPLDAAICTSYTEEGSAHPKLLRTSANTKGKTAAFRVQRRERQAAPAPRPIAASSSAGRRRAHAERGRR